jgi:hypothetical protein
MQAPVLDFRARRCWMKSSLCATCPANRCALGVGEAGCREWQSVSETENASESKSQMKRSCACGAVDTKLITPTPHLRRTSRNEAQSTSGSSRGRRTARFAFARPNPSTSNFFRRWKPHCQNGTPRTTTAPTVTCKPFDVVNVPFPFTERRTSKRRRALAGARGRAPRGHYRTVRRSPAGAPQHRRYGPWPMGRTGTRVGQTLALPLLAHYRETYR